MARLIDLTEINIPAKRQRAIRSQQDHQDLFVSISEGEAGLIHAPLLWEDEGGKKWLVVGEGRLKVISEMYDLGIQLKYEGQEVPLGQVPYTLIGLASHIGRYEAEFDENVRRTPLTVAERASATAHLYELKKMKAAEAGHPAPTIQDLAVEMHGSKLGDYQNNIRKELIVARHLDDSDVRNATSVREAFNVVKKKETQRKATALAKEMGTRTKKSNVELVHGDAVEHLRGVAAGRFSIILTDMPYGMGADTFGVYNDSGDHKYDDSYSAWVELLDGITPQLNRVAAADAHMYLFCDFDRFHELKIQIEQSEGGWQVHRTPIIWENPTGFRTPWPDSGPQRKYEIILYAKRGTKKTLKVHPDLVRYSRDKDSIHPAQKPVALMMDLLSRSAMPTDEVLDFCAGSAATGVACHQMKLAALCIEKDADAYARALMRVQQLKD